MTKERYGISMDEWSATLLDRLDDAFEGTNYTITEYDGLAISRNRHMMVEAEYDDYPHGKVPKQVFDAVDEAICRVTGIHTGVGSATEFRVWVEAE
jgi:hypothetical protein